MPERSNRHRIVRHHIDKKLVFRTRMFAVVFLVMVALLSYDVYKGTIGLPLTLGGFLIGICVGFFAGRMIDIKWHEDSQKVVGRMDGLGVVILVLYMAFSIFKSRFFGEYIHGVALTAFSFSIMGGVMLGRVISSVSNIRKILKNRKIIR